jgi:hypothetical protein
VEIKKSSKRHLFPTRYDDFVVALVQAPYEPTNSFETVGSHAWQTTMEYNKESIRKYQTWKLVQLLIGKRPIPSKWVYKIKIGINGKPNKYKAQLVAKGCQQQKGVDYDKKFAPVVKWGMICLVIALSIYHNLNILQMDV